MKTILTLVILSLSLSLSARTVTIDGALAKNLMEALFQSGIPLKEVRTGIITQKVDDVKCHGTRENHYTGGEFKIIHCYLDDKIKLKNSISLENALIKAGADFDAATGKWWVFVKDLMCQFEPTEHSEYNCSFSSIY